MNVFQNLMKIAAYEGGCQQLYGAIQVTRNSMGVGGVRIRADQHYKGVQPNVIRFYTTKGDASVCL